MHLKISVMVMLPFLFSVLKTIENIFIFSSWVKNEDAD